MSVLGKLLKANQKEEPKRSALFDKFNGGNGAPPVPVPSQAQQDAEDSRDMGILIAAGFLPRHCTLQEFRLYRDKNRKSAETLAPHTQVAESSPVAKQEPTQDSITRVTLPPPVAVPVPKQEAVPSLKQEPQKDAPARPATKEERMEHAIMIFSEVSKALDDEEKNAVYNSMIYAIWGADDIVWELWTRLLFQGREAYKTKIEYQERMAAKQKTAPATSAPIEPPQSEPIPETPKSE